MAERPGSLLAQLVAWAARAPQAEAAREGAVAWSVGELLAHAEAMAERLRQAGVAPGACVAFQGPPSLASAAALLGTWKAGATYVGVHPRYTAREVDQVISRVRPAAVVRSTAGQLEVSRGSLGPRVFAADAGPALLVFTTGSTGEPKAAMLSHAAVAQACASQAAAMTHAVAHAICALPVNHVGALVNITGASWWSATSVAFVPEFSVEALTDVMRPMASVRLPAVPALLQRCLDDPGHAEAFAAAARGRLLHVLSGGAPLPRRVVDGFAALGASVQGMYGLTEVSGSVCFTAAGDAVAVVCETVGRAHADVALRIAPVDGLEVAAAGDAPAATTGELQVRGAQCFAGYLDDADATAAAFTADGWLRTGDLARQRADGRLELTGRLKAVINMRGYKIMPREIESVLLAHDAVEQAAVIGVPDAQRGEAVMAFVTGARLDGTAAAQLEAWCRRQLAPHKVPVRIQVLPALPLLGVGKVDAAALRALAQPVLALRTAAAAGSADHA